MLTGIDVSNYVTSEGVKRIALNLKLIPQKISKISRKVLKCVSNMLFITLESQSGLLEIGVGGQSTESSSSLLITGGWLIGVEDLSTQQPLPFLVMTRFFSG